MKKVFTKCLLLVVTIALLLGHLSPLHYVIAEGIESPKVESVVEEELDNKDETDEQTTQDTDELKKELDGQNEETDTVEEKEIETPRSEETVEKNIELEEENVEETESIEVSEETVKTVKEDNREKFELRLFFHIEKDDLSKIDAAFQEFLSAYSDLTIEEIVENIDGFQLYVDDEKSIKSRFGSFVPSDFGAQENAKLIETLNAIKSEQLIQSEPLMQSRMFSSRMSTNSTNDTTVERISGQNRVEVAINISREGWTTSGTVVIANGYRFTDALSGTPLAAHYNAPMLLVDEKDITTATLNEIKRLKATKIIILGGTSSVPEHISKKLSNQGLNVRRIAGENRYDTSRKIAEELISLRGASSGYLVNGDAYADAVSISSVAGRYMQPILLTRANELHPEVASLTNKVKDWRIIGGTTSISSHTESQLKNRVTTATRLSGKNRYEVNKRVLNHWGIKGNQLYVGHGNAFADVLTASLLAAKQSTGVLLVSNSRKDILDGQQFVKDHNMSNFTLLGGNHTISKSIVDAFEKLYKVVFIDPGHGGVDPGARGNLSGKTIREKDLNLSISLKLRDRLKAQGYTVLMSREADTTISMIERARKANNTNADIFISIHHNSMGGSSTSVHGIETIYYKAHKDYPTAINKEMHNDPVRIAESKKLAHAVQDGLIAKTGAKYRRVFSGAYVVTKETRMPAIIPELGFMSNPTELRNITNASYQEKLLNGLVQGVNDYFNN